MAINPEEIDVTTVDKLDDLNLALGNFFAHTNLNGKLGKSDFAKLAEFLAPYITAIGGSGFLATTGTVLPSASAGKFTIVGAGTFTQTTGGDIVTTELFNILGSSDTTWGLVNAIPLLEYFKKSDLNDLNFETLSRNQLIASDMIGGEYIDINTGNRISIEGWSATRKERPIRVKPNTLYSANMNLVPIVFLDSNSNFLSGIENLNPNGQFTTPNNCQYIETFARDTDKDYITIVEGALTLNDKGVFGDRRLGVLAENVVGVDLLGIEKLVNGNDLFDASKIRRTSATGGTYVDYLTGKVIPIDDTANDKYYTFKARIKPGKTYEFGDIYRQQFALYTKAGVYISGYAATLNGESKRFTAPLNAYYIVFTGTLAAIANQYLIELSGVVELHNPANKTNGKYVDYATGNLLDNAATSVTTVSVKPNTTYEFGSTVQQQLVWKRKDGSYISGYAGSISGYENQLTSPNGAFIALYTTNIADDVSQSFRKVEAQDVVKTIKITAVKNAANWNSIRDTATAIKDSSKNKRYIITVPFGVWNEIDLGGYGDFIKIVGQDRYRTFIDTLGASTNANYIIPSDYMGTGEYAGQQIASVPLIWKHTVFLRKNLLISNITLRASNCKYTLHADDNRYAKFIGDNISFEETANCNNVIGMGIWGGQNFELTNFSVKRSTPGQAGIFFHNWNNQLAGTKTLFKNGRFINCYYADVSELGSDQEDTLIFENCSSDVENKIKYFVTIENGATMYTIPGGSVKQTNPLLVPYSIHTVIAGTNVDNYDITSGQRPDTLLYLQRGAVNASKSDLPVYSQDKPDIPYFTLIASTEYVNKSISSTSEIVSGNYGLSIAYDVEPEGKLLLRSSNGSTYSNIVGLYDKNMLPIGNRLITGNGLTASPVEYNIPVGVYKIVLYDRLMSNGIKYPVELSIKFPAGKGLIINGVGIPIATKADLVNKASVTTQYTPIEIPDTGEHNNTGLVNFQSTIINVGTTPATDWSDFIPVEPNSEYELVQTGSVLTSSVAWYDSNKSPLPGRLTTTLVKNNKIKTSNQTFFILLLKRNGTNFYTYTLRKILDSKIEAENFSLNVSDVLPYFRERPTSGIVNFTVPINVNIANVNEQTLNNQDSNIIHDDWGVLFLPVNYDQYGKPIKLIIGCHGTGTWINGSTTTSIAKDFWLSQGYALLDMNGIPESFGGNGAVDDKIRHYGSPIALQSYLKGYQYAIQNYNIANDGCLIFGISMGGLSSFMLAQSGSIPVIAQGAFCPCIDLFKQAYSRPWNGAVQRQKISQLFGFEGVAPTFTATIPPTQPEIDYFVANRDKIIGYENMLKNVFDADVAALYAYKTAATSINDAGEDALYSPLHKMHRVPLKIWHNTDDTTVLYRYSKHYVNMTRNSGGLAVLRTFPSGGHNAWLNGAIVSGIPTISGGTISIETSMYECYLWFKRFE